MWALITWALTPWAHMPWDFLLILIVLGTVVPWRGAVRIKRIFAKPTLSGSERISLYASTIAMQWLLVAVVGWRAFARGLTAQDLGLTVPAFWRAALIAVAVTALLCLNQWASLRRIASLPYEQRGFVFQFTEKIMPRSGRESLVFSALACTAGLSEEFIYRGFLLAVFFRAFFNSGLPTLSSSFSTIIAVLLSSAVFAIGHLYQGWRGVVTTFVAGLLFAGIRIWSHSLFPPMTAHIAVDLMAGLYAPRLLRTDISSQVTASK